MQRIRFLTTIAVGAMLTEGLDENPKHPECPPHLVWEWLVVESIVRLGSQDGSALGIPGTLVTRRALSQHGYLDYRSYLKTPRIFGFHGVYKRLALHLHLVDVHLAILPNAEVVVDRWARDHGKDGFSPGSSRFQRWRNAIERSLRETPVRTRPGWSKSEWEDLAQAFLPNKARAREKRKLKELLHQDDETALGALPSIWALQEEFSDESYSEEELHRALARRQPIYSTLLDAIAAYERFCRSLQDSFDLLRAEAGGPDAQGYVVTEIRKDPGFALSIDSLFEQFCHAREAVGQVDSGLATTLDSRFAAFAKPLEPGDVAMALCEHHEQVQKGKSLEGKRAWFDRLGPDRIFVRHNYRVERPDRKPNKFVHDYRGGPIRRFWQDLQ